MAGVLLHNLTALTSPSDDDIFYIEDSPGGTPADRKITFGNLKAAVVASISANMLYVVAYTTTGQTRPSWPGPVAWVGNYTSLGAPTNRLAGDWVLDVV